jgi:mono/diheme cytochrome c family protein
MISRRAIFVTGLILAAGLTAITAASRLVAPAPPETARHFADADDAALVTEGNHLYRGHCASCHGRQLQGQPLWQLMDENAGRRAPAHDASGHTWQHADEALFRMTKFGTAEATAPGAVSAMPAFENQLSDREILAVIAFIKARWPLGLRVSQALRNPGYAGMPADAGTVEWRLPPTCNVVLQRATLTSRKGG